METGNKKADGPDLRPGFAPKNISDPGSGARRWILRLLCFVGMILIISAVLGWVLWRPLVWQLTPDIRSELESVLAQGGALADRNGKILRLFPDRRGDFRVFNPLASCSRMLVDAVLAAEDKHFYLHAGVDPVAIARAAWLNLRRGRVVSGASTITQQVIRILRPRRRTVRAKLSEMLLALKLEMQTDKDRILEAYLNLAPMFGNVRGMPLAARLMFDGNPGVLTPEKAATLAAFPKSPRRYRPHGVEGRAFLEKRRNQILELLGKQGTLTRAQVETACRLPLSRPPLPLPFHAPHFVDWWLRTEGTPVGEVRTSLDVTLQEHLLAVLASHRQRLSRAGASQAAAMVVHTPTMEVRAMSGSFEYGLLNGGWNDGCQAPRSGGSILKPFLTALALENGYTAASVVADTRRTFTTPSGDYLPLNANRANYGPVSLRAALGNSLNVTAVRLLNELGIVEFHSYLVDLGILEPRPGAAERFGLGLAIGNPEVRMTDLMAAYGAFAHQGTRVALRIRPNDAPATRGQTLMSAATAFIVLDILADPSARLLTFGNPRFYSGPGRMAIKTGTSTNYRDSWLIAVHPEYLVAFWVGNFDGREANGLSGAVACGPMLYDLRRVLFSTGEQSWFTLPATVVSGPVCGISGSSPTPFCPVTSTELFARGHLPKEPCSFHRSGSDFHELPPEYAQWLANRRGRLRNDPFTLAGDETFDPGNHSPEARCSAEASSSEVGIARTGLATPSERAAGIPRSKDIPALNDGFKPIDISIVSPLAGDHFIRMPGQANTTRLRAVPERPVPEIVWLIDGREFARTPPPYETTWSLHPGEHTISAWYPGGEATQIRVFVE